MLQRLLRYFRPAPNPAPAADPEAWVGRTCTLLERGFTVLSNGRINSCCVEPQGVNVFDHLDARVDDLAVAHVEAKRRFATDRDFMPACRNCPDNVDLYGDTAENRRTVERFIAAPMTSIDLETTSHCNAACLGCIHGTDDVDALRESKRNLDLETMKRALAPIVADLTMFQPFTYSEPFSYKELPELCRWVRERNPALTISVSTNGSAFGRDERIERIVRSGISIIYVSVHGSTQAISAKYMVKAPFDGMVDGVGRFMKVRKRMGESLPRVYLKSVLFEWNDSDAEIAAFRKLAADLGTDGVLFGYASGGINASKRFELGSDAQVALYRETHPQFTDPLWPFREAS